MDELDGDAVQPDHGHDYPTHKRKVDSFVKFIPPKPSAPSTNPPRKVVTVN